jgi:hypothetical protein
MHEEIEGGGMGERVVAMATSSEPPPCRLHVFGCLRCLSRIHANAFRFTNNERWVFEKEVERHDYAWDV